MQKKSLIAVVIIVGLLALIVVGLFYSYKQAPQPVVEEQPAIETEVAKDQSKESKLTELEQTSPASLPAGEIEQRLNELKVQMATDEELRPLTEEEMDAILGELTEDGLSEKQEDTP